MNISGHLQNENTFSFFHVTFFLLHWPISAQFQLPLYCCFLIFLPPLFHLLPCQVLLLNIPNISSYVTSLTWEAMCVCMIWSHVAAGWPGGRLGGTCILRNQWQARRNAFSAGHLVSASWQLGKSNSTWCFSAAEGPNKWFFKLQETHGPPVVQACYKGWTFQQGKEVRSWKQSCQKPGRQRDFFFLDMLNNCPRKHLLLS